MLAAYLAVALVLAGVAVLLCQWAYARFPAYRIADSNGARLAGRGVSIAINGAVVGGMYALALAAFGDRLIRPGPSYWYEPIVFLLVYDLAYYCLHRSLHHPVLMRLLHGVHHRIKHPSAVESLYSHPVDTVIAFTLLFACMALVGPLGLTSFVVSISLYTVIFGLGHANLRLPVKSLALVNHWARRHDAHHAQRNVNFGSVTPVWDWLFGTAADSIRR